MSKSSYCENPISISLKIDDGRDIELTMRANLSFFDGPDSESLAWKLIGVLADALLKETLERGGTRLELEV